MNLWHEARGHARLLELRLQDIPESALYAVMNWRRRRYIFPDGSAEKAQALNQRFASGQLVTIIEERGNWTDCLGLGRRRQVRFIGAAGGGVTVPGYERWTEGLVLAQEDGILCQGAEDVIDIRPV